MRQTVAPPSRRGIRAERMADAFAHLPYRRCVGIFLMNGEGRVWVGRRLSKWSGDVSDRMWQMPQGGIDEGETPRAAALRELHEEIGSDSAEIVAESARWLSYDLPPEALGIALNIVGLAHFAGGWGRWVIGMRSWPRRIFIGLLAIGASCEIFALIYFAGLGWADAAPIPLIFMLSGASIAIIASALSAWPHPELARLIRREREAGQPAVIRRQLPPVDLTQMIVPDAVEAQVDDGQEDQQHQSGLASPGRQGQRQRRASDEQGARVQLGPKAAFLRVKLAMPKEPRRHQY